MFPVFWRESVQGKIWKQFRDASYLLIFQGGMWYGVDINNEDIADNFKAFVWEPAMVRINALTAASEAACLIVSVDETIKNPRSTVDAPPAAGRGEVVAASTEKHFHPLTIGRQSGCRVPLHSLFCLN